MQTYAEEKRFVGIPLSNGVALGRGCQFVTPQMPVGGLRVGDAGPNHERRRLRDALTQMIARLGWLARDVDGTLGADEAAIFQAQRMMLEDDGLWNALTETVEQSGATAEHAVRVTLDRLKGHLRQAPSESMRELAWDLAEIERGLLTELEQAVPFLRCRNMAHCPVGHCQLQNPHILVASELTPALVIEMDDLTLGLISEHGGPTAHAAILARAMGLPAVSGIDTHMLCGSLEADLLIDGDLGQVIVSPDPETIAAYGDRLRSAPRRMRVAEPVPGLQVLANIDLASHVDEVLAARAEGVGLYRTEMEVFSMGRFLDEEEQYARYASVIEALGDQPVYIRLLDLGGDKSAEFLGLPAENNPALGQRGARLLLARPELLRAQARALARASTHGPIHVIVPMVIDVEQFLRLKAAFLAETADLRAGTLLFGVMFEVPSACLQAQQILAAADFGCVGTNDLVQYLFAMDRGNTAVAMDGIHLHPVLWAVIEDLARAAKETGRALSLCGELAGDATLIGRLVQAGIQRLSITPRRIAEIRGAARTVPRLLP